MKISLLLPTRGRPNNLQRFINSVLKTSFDIGNIELVVRIDDDDKASQNFFESIRHFNHLNISIVSGKRNEVLSDNWNECWKAATGEIYQLCGDDIVFESMHWDSIVRNKFCWSPHKILLVYGQDKKRNTPTHPWIHKNWTDVVGYFTPSKQIYGNDTWLWEIASMLGVSVFAKEIITPHLHPEVSEPGFEHVEPVIGESGWDQTYEDLRLKRESRNDFDRFYSPHCKELRRKDAQLLHNFIISKTKGIYL